MMNCLGKKAQESLIFSMVRIEKKIVPQYFDAVASGKKKHELRLADWACKEGDVLVLRECL